MGVTVMVPVISFGVGLANVKVPILPVPAAPKPMPILSLLQLKIVLGTIPEKVTGSAIRNSHLDWSATWITLGIGFTRTEKLVEGPKQVLVKGRTVNIDVMGIPPTLVALNAGILPLPELASKPISVLV